MRYAEPLAGIRAAQTIKRTADRVADEYVKHAPRQAYWEGKRDSGG
jgi:hypothetical protein